MTGKEYSSKLPIKNRTTLKLFATKQLNYFLTNRTEKMRSKIILILSFLFSISILAQDVRIVASNSNELVFKYSPSFRGVDTISVNGNQFISVSFKDADNENPFEFGSPKILFKKIPIGVPKETGNTIEILDYNFSEVNGNLIPNLDSKLPEKDFKLSAEYFSAKNDFEIVTFAEFAIARSIPIQYLKIYPVQFLAPEKKIRLLKSVTIKIKFAPAQTQNITDSDPMLSDVIINYSVAKKWLLKNNSLKKTTATSSVLASGKWFRFETPQEGFYKITRSQLSAYGIDAASVDPRTIKIYNNGGKPLPEKNSSPRYADLHENAIYISGESDGKFDEGDYILFYGRNFDFWNYDTIARNYLRVKNTYANKNYYWITSGGTNGKRMEQVSGAQKTTSPFVQTNTIAFQHLEDEKINIGKTGKHFVGDEFSETNKTRTYTRTLEERDNNFPVFYRYAFVNNSPSNIPFRIDENNNLVLSKTIFGYGSYQYSYGIIDSSIIPYSSAIADNRSNLKFTYSAAGPNSYGYLDYYEIIFKRKLKVQNDLITFFSYDSTTTVEYQLTNFTITDIHVFDVTDHSAVKKIVNPIKQSAGEFYFQKDEQYQKVSKYIAYCGEKFLSPVNAIEIKNQDLHGISEGAKYLIISPKEFSSAAERLKNYRQTSAKVSLSGLIVEVDQIYNEFSGGLKDPTAIRDFIRHSYFNWNTKPEYVLLFGDGDYDYRNIEKLNKNFIPPLETEEYLSAIYSYSVDDYFASVDGDDTVADLALGRLPVQSLTEANIMVDKIIFYETQATRGNWRNLVTLVADDALTSSGVDGAPNTPQSEDLANDVIPKSFDLNKIYLVNYPTVYTSLGRRKPGVNQAIIDAVNDGSVLLNFIGHGSPEVWTHEQVFIKDVSIPQFVNDKYFFLTAATCDFGYFDNPNSQSGMEVMLLKQSSGAIGGFTSVRPVYSHENAALNEKFYSKMLSAVRDTMNLPFPIGYAYYKTKVEKHSVNDLKYLLFSDPALRLNLPQYNASIDSMNGNSFATVQQVKALSEVTISGSVKKPDGSVWNDFNGKLELTVFDSDRILPLPEISLTQTMTVKGGKIFNGLVSIKNGIFSTTFVVPKDISYENKNGKIIAYFSDETIDGLGFTSNFIVGGTDSTVANDFTGPEIEIYFDQITDNNGLLVNPNSLLIVALKDEKGLNTTGTGVGHQLLGVLNDDLTNSIDLSNYFEGDLDNGNQSGKINYKLPNLSEGEYKIEITAWDVFNNSSKEIEYFKVVNSNDLVIDQVYNYPNPFSSNTVFTFQQNLTSPIDVGIRIYSVAGRLIHSINQKNITEKFVKIDWDGKDIDGNFLANGTYLYKMKIKTVDGAFSKSVLGKIAIAR